jgi:hypothetical protein
MFNLISVADPDPDLFVRIRSQTFGTRSGSEDTKIDIFLPFLVL